MATYVEINNTRYPATIGGKMVDKDWDNRASKFIHLTMSYEEAIKLFIDEIDWNIIQEEEELNENDEIVIKTEIYDNSSYSIAGSITDHRDGTITVKMGQPTPNEILAILLGEEK